MARLSKEQQEAMNAYNAYDSTDSVTELVHLTTAQLRFICDEYFGIGYCGFCKSGLMALIRKERVFEQARSKYGTPEFSDLDLSVLTMDNLYDVMEYADCGISCLPRRAYNNDGAINAATKDELLELMREARTPWQGVDNWAEKFGEPGLEEHMNPEVLEMLSTFRSVNIAIPF